MCRTAPRDWSSWNAKRVGPPGFTLVELLVVVAIIALLLSVLLPALRASRRQAKQAVCLANLRQVGYAVHLYANDFGDQFPASLHWGYDFSRGTPWGYALYGYIAGEPWSRNVAREQWVRVLNSVYHCPLDEILTKAEEPFDQWSYGINVYLGPPVDELKAIGVSWHTLSRIPRPAGTITLAEMAARSAMWGGGRADHVMAHFWTVYGAPAGTEIDQQRHDPGSAYLMVDGHAAPAAFTQTFNAEMEINDWDPAAAQ